LILVLHRLLQRVIELLLETHFNPPLAACYDIEMRLFNKLGVIAALVCATTAWAQDGDYQGQQGPDDQQQQYQQQQYQQQQYQDQQQQQYQQPPDSQYPPPDPNAYAQQAPQYGYMGAHPIPYDVGSGFCYERGAHFHSYAPFDKYLFREYGGWFYFVGDAGDFGYAQQLWGYNGHHPIPLAYGGGYCFIGWPHRHHYPPPYGTIYNLVSGYYVYGGPWDPWYWRWRPYYTGYFGGYYRTSYFGGSYWRVRPPPVYRPTLVIGAPGYYRAGAVAVVPGGARVYVSAPAPAYRGGPVPATAVSRGVPIPANRVVTAAPAARVATPGAPVGYRPGAPAPAYHPMTAPAYHPTAAPAYHPAPAPAYHPAPAPAYHPAPAPAYHPAPAAPARQFHR
jgi:hypothetical protein